MTVIVKPKYAHLGLPVNKRIWNWSKCGISLRALSSNSALYNDNHCMMSRSMDVMSINLRKYIKDSITYEGTSTTIRKQKGYNRPGPHRLLVPSGLDHISCSLSNDVDHCLRMSGRDERLRRSNFDQYQYRTRNETDSRKRKHQQS